MVGKKKQKWKPQICMLLKSKGDKGCSTRAKQNWPGRSLLSWQYSRYRYLLSQSCITFKLNVLATKRRTWGKKKAEKILIIIPVIFSQVLPIINLFILAHNIFIECMTQTDSYNLHAFFYVSFSGCCLLIQQKLYLVFDNLWFWFHQHWSRRVSVASKPWCNENFAPSAN